MSRSGPRPEVYRVLVKSRYNQNERAEPINRSSLNQVGRSEQIDWRSKRGQSNYTEMKDYVNRRMKTDHS